MDDMFLNDFERNYSYIEYSHYFLPFSASTS